MYVILDLETTGLRPNEDRIIEIALLKHDGKKIIDRFQSLVNPERYVPEFITRLTNISNDMLAAAPRFFELAKQIVEFSENCVLVAHNAHFDYGFLKAEFKQLGFSYQRKTLCTVRLSRKIFPHQPSYALGKLCAALGIAHQNAHRAAGDAEATAKLLEKLLGKNEDKVRKQIVEAEIKAKNLPPKISHEAFDALPEQTGVYYFKDDAGRIIYIGKSKNIKKRVASHFASNIQQGKSIEFKNRVADIDYILTGSELLALLLESDEIKQHKPLFNKAQRRSRFHYGIFLRKGRDGYLKFYVDKVKNQTKTALYVATRSEGARQALRKRVQEFELCMRLCGLYPGKDACFDYQIKQCAGACIGEESPEKYNLRAQAAADSFNRYRRKNFIIKCRGREKGEVGLVCVEQGRYLGFGYVAEAEVQIHRFAEAKNYIRRYKDNKDVQKIIWAWLKKHPQQVLVLPD